MKKFVTTLMAVAAMATLTATANATDGEATYPTITVKNFTIGGCDMLSADPGLKSVTSGAKIHLEIEPVEKAVCMKVEIYKPDMSETIRSAVTIDGTAATGIYDGSILGKLVTKFYDNEEYTIVLTAQTTKYPSASDPTACILAKTQLKFKGSTPAYQYSPAQFVSFNPADGSEVTDATQPIIVTFSEPVASVACWATTGGQGATQITLTEFTPNTDKTVWSINASPVWNNEGSEWTFYVSAKDAEGRTVKGNHGVDAASDYMLVIGCYLNWPTVAISPQAGNVKSLYEFTVDENRGIDFAYTGKPYVVNEAGETVATVDLASKVQYDAQGNDISTLPASDVKAVKMTFHLDKEITTPGKYTLIIPRASFNIGKEQSADFNRYMTIEYTVDTNVGVFTVNSHEYGIESNGGTLLVNGLEADDHVGVYSLNSMKIAEKYANGGIVEFNIPQGQIYIVKINEVSIKVAH